MHREQKRTKHKEQSTNREQSQKTKSQSIIFELEERTFKFAAGIIKLCRNVSKDTINDCVTRQLIRSSGSVGANYREANEALSKKDFLHRMKITRKECKESSYWLRLLQESTLISSKIIEPHINESRELRNIFTSIINKFQ